MTRMNLDIVGILGDRYDIELNEYFTLSVEERDYLAKYVVSMIFLELRRHPETIGMYEYLLKDRIGELSLTDEFELADLYQRILNEIILTYS